MIENDKEYQEAFEEFMKSKGVDVETRKYYLCEDLGCNNCILKDVRRDLDFCTFHPFEEIKRREKEIRMLKQQISIMSDWKRNRDMNKTLQDFCKTFRSGNNNPSELTCYGINCNTCPFGGIGNLKEWARRAKAKTEVKRND